MCTSEEHFEGDSAVLAEMSGSVHDAHAALAQHLQDFMTRDQGKIG
jgi:hypothetical protein